MKSLDLSIIISGKISSGKSTLAKELSKVLEIPIASFGEYLLDLSDKKNLKKDRESVQDLGNKLILEDHSTFLDAVMMFSDPYSNSFIFEGVRHLLIFDTISRKSNTATSIFLNTSEELRLRRFLNRSKEMDKNLTEKDFFKRQEHPVEKEVDAIKEKSFLVLSVIPDIDTLSKLLFKQVY